MRTKNTNDTDAAARARRVVTAGAGAELRMPRNARAK